MGIGMATNLQNHLSQTSQPGLIYHNRTASRGEPLRALGARPATSVPQLVAEADVVFLSLSDDAALEATVDALLSSEDVRGRLVVDTSTVHPDSSLRASQRLAAAGASFVTAPVFGASPVAAQGKLLFVLAGPAIEVARVEPFVEGVMGRAVIRLGEDVRQASLLKTTGNFLTAGMMELVAEASVLAEKTSLPAHALPSLLSLQYGPLAASMADRLSSGAYLPPPDERPWSDLNLAVKDVGHGVSVAEENGCRLPVGETVLEHLKRAQQVGADKGRALDSSSLYGVLREDAGLDFESDAVKRRDGSGS